MYQMMEVCNCKTTLDDQKEFLYRYFLVESKKDMLMENKYVSVPSYGIHAVREELLGGKITSIYNDTVESVSPDKSKVMGLIQYLRDNEVSPIHLVDITGEMIDEWITDYDLEAKNVLSQMVFA